ncbi:hypothetical protein FRB94_002566 [Tulasnella sp. JGI-2019a]|nr:hypothetical protein FRB93_010215 [Tulasnella sp. JGI-2019a]KAG9013491.1 hypothetical protein FRB94_002566 [Tulasnella sp. JGI-2019a]
MDRKRKWDQPAINGDDESPTKLVKTEDGKAASDAAAAAAAIAAKIAAQFATPAPLHATGTIEKDKKDPHDAEFTHDIEINDVRNRYMLTKGATQQQIHQETGASVTTKGIWYPDKAKATEKDPPLYLHISATTEDILKVAITKVEELINTELGPLTEERRREDRPRERRKWPDEKIFVNLDTLRNFNVRAKVVGPAGMFVKHIQSETGTRVQIKGLGSGFYDSETGRESDEPMHIHITGPDEHQVDRAKILTEDLLEVVRAEHAKAKAAMYQQQLELHQAQAYYSSYGMASGLPGSDIAPPPPPSDAPPPPPPEDGSAPPPPPPSDPAAVSHGGMHANPSPQGSHDAFAQYWAAYGYDVNSEEFKKWMATQQQQYAQYYVAPGATAPQAGPPNPGAPPPPPDLPPPPPPA